MLANNTTRTAKNRRHRLRSELKRLDIPFESIQIGETPVTHVPIGVYELRVFGSLDTTSVVLFHNGIDEHADHFPSSQTDLIVGYIYGMFHSLKGEV